MSEMSDFLEDELVDHIFRTATFTKPTVLSFALLTTNADDNDTGTFTTSTGVEVTAANAYERGNDANTGGGASNTTNPLDANWAAPTAGDGVTSNLSAITYAQATGSWGTVTGIGITNSATHDAGDLLFHSAVDTSRAIDNGDTAEFAIAAITVTFD